ncbi:MAG: hypothetical protein JO316_05615 [Abitibacteriaceae bacterium]|nr:hypothetical protein [Abditibacteriaceae bacterium]
MLLSREEVDTMSDAATENALRRIMPDLYFVNAPVSQRRLHLQLLTRVPQENLILDFLPRPGTPLTELTICAYDDAEPGLLSKLCGTLAALSVHIQTAFIYTLQEQSLIDQAHSDNSAREVVLDTLLLSESYFGRMRALTDKTVQRVRDELTRILGGQITVTQLLTRTHWRPYPPLHIYDISSQPGTANQAVITLRAEDHPGVLYRTTAGLAALGLDIQVAQINTAESAIDDIFYVTKTSDTPFTEAEAQSIAPQLRSILQASSAPPGLAGEF